MREAAHPIENVVDYGRQVDFGKTAADYGRHRAGYPDELYERLARLGVVREGRSVLDLATGTGFLGRGFARRGCRVVGLDISLALMLEAGRLDSQEGLAMGYVRARAEALPIREHSFDVVCAGQSWHWFDRAAAAAGARRALRPGGFIVIAHFDWLPLPGNVVDATEQLIVKHNPEWRLAGGLGIYPLWPRDLAIAGFNQIETFSFDVMAPYTHDGWRGRIRASAGVGGTLGPEQVAVFDQDLAAVLREKYPDDPMGVHHRACAIVARSPA